MIRATIYHLATETLCARTSGDVGVLERADETEQVLCRGGGCCEQDIGA